ncbi:MAG: VOC family protein [Chloroflexi bacterium]|nr:VOC family protein [Chloroflexota bacterium]
MEAQFVNIAVAVKDIDEAIKVYGDILGTKLDGKVNEQPALGIKTAMIRGNGFEFELISPLPGERTLTRFLETRGEGIYRLAYGVKNIDQAIAQFRAKGVSVVEAQASVGKIAFTHPKPLKGVMLELVQR